MTQQRHVFKLFPMARSTPGEAVPCVFLLPEDLVVLQERVEDVAVAKNVAIAINKACHGSEDPTDPSEALDWLFQPLVVAG
jgi:hypothetical protein